MDERLTHMEEKYNLTLTKANKMVESLDIEHQKTAQNIIDLDKMRGKVKEIKKYIKVLKERDRK